MYLGASLIFRMKNNTYILKNYDLIQNRTYKIFLPCIKNNFILKNILKIIKK